jgi:DNA gyrase/topoisomerase IV subunit A
MEHNEIIEELNRLKGEIDKLEKELNKPQDETIYVPKGILEDKTKEIINGKHRLFYDEDGWNAMASSVNIKSTEKQYKLVPCERKDLKAGDVAFFYILEGQTDINYVKEDLSCYCFIAEKGIVFWSEEDGGVSVYEKLNSDHVWYKVVKA